MSSVHHAAHRPPLSPSPMRKLAIKAGRSAPSNKSALLVPKISVKGVKTVKKAQFSDEEVLRDEDDDMVTSFLQFCAMCDKQIVVPNSSILYCSESCRRNDTSIFSDVPHLQTRCSPAKPALNCEEWDAFGSKFPTYLAPLTPTPRTIPEGRIPAKFHNGESDLDPTEWKPAEGTVTDRQSPTKSGEWRPKVTHRSSSEASSFLGKFHSFNSAAAHRRRVMIGHGSTTVSTPSTPRLSHTPTASTSSGESLSGTPYEFVVHPTAGMPVATALKQSEGVEAGKDLTYEKKHVGASLISATGSLKKLLDTSGAP